MFRLSRRTLVAAAAVAACFSLVALAHPLQEQVKKAPAAGPAKLWVVTLELEKWDTSKAPTEQPGFMEHMTHVHQMAVDGTLLVGGPFLDSFESGKPTGAMMIVAAESADAARRTMTDDAVIKNGLMKIESVRAFTAGAGKWLAPAQHAASEGR
jgi:uncharacterized protein YciI